MSEEFELYRRVKILMYTRSQKLFRVYKVFYTVKNENIENRKCQVLLILFFFPPESFKYIRVL